MTAGRQSAVQHVLGASPPRRSYSDAARRGATDEEITDVVRAMQANLLFSLCYVLEDPGAVEPKAADIAWALVQVDGEGNVVAIINGLHESVLETDPTRREMRPRPDAK